jgi:selenium metabolism protein YedF
MEKQIDARDMNCPLPVILTKKALDEIEEGRVVAIVNSETAKENISKLARSMTCSIDIEQVGAEYHINIFKQKTAAGVESHAATRNGLVVLIGSDMLGEGDKTLGRVLMKAYINTLVEVWPVPETLIFVNSGVNLAVDGSEVLESLKRLEGMGVEILCCGTCLNYYHLEDKLAVGQISNMYVIVEKLNNAENTIKL